MAIRRIRNKRTGEIREVDESQLGQYGLAPQPQAPAISPTPSAQTFPPESIVTTPPTSTGMDINEPQFTDRPKYRSGYSLQQLSKGIQKARAAGDTKWVKQMEAQFDKELEYQEKIKTSEDTSDFKASIEKAKENLMQGWDWGDVYQGVAAQFPGLQNARRDKQGNDVIDRALGPQWKEKYAFQKFMNKINANTPDYIPFEIPEDNQQESQGLLQQLMGSIGELFKKKKISNVPEIPQTRVQAKVESAQLTPETLAQPSWVGQKIIQSIPGRIAKGFMGEPGQAESSTPEALGEAIAYSPIGALAVGGIKLPKVVSKLLKPTIKTLPEIKQIPKQLQPLAEEARKYKSGGELLKYNQMSKEKIFVQISGREQPIPIQNVKEQIERVGKNAFEDLANGKSVQLPNGEWVYPPKFWQPNQPFKSVQDFYAQATGGKSIPLQKVSPVPEVPAVRQLPIIEQPQIPSGIPKPAPEIPQVVGKPSLPTIIQQGVKQKAPEDVLDTVREVLYKGDNKGAKQLYDEIAKDFEIPPFKNLTKELDVMEATALKEGGYIPFAQYGNYQDEAKKMQNFLKTKAEVTSKVSGELYREHIPKSVFGVSSDEVSSALGMSESEFMTKILPEVAGGKATPQVLKTFGQKIQRIKEMGDALKLDKEFYKVIEGFDVTKLVGIPSYKAIKPYRAPGGVAVEPTEKTLQTIAEKEKKLSIATNEKLFNDWMKTVDRETTLTKTQFADRMAKTIREATNQGINDAIKVKTGNVHIFDIFRTPENVFRKLGLSEPFNNLRTATGKYENEVATQFNKMNDWYKQVKGVKGSEQRIFNYLDGQLIPLSQPEIKVATEIKQFLAGLADRQNLAQDRRITDYITHIFEPELAKQQLPPELMAALEYATPRGVFNPFLEKRLGASGYIKDVWRALEAYTTRSLRKIHLDQPIDNMGEYVNHLPEGAQLYTKTYLNYIVGRPDVLERFLDSTFKMAVSGISNKEVQRYFAGRPTKKIFGAINQQIYRGGLGLNVGSALRNLTQVVNTFAEEGPIATIRGYMSLLNKGNLTEVEKANLLSEMITAEYRNKPIRNFLQKFDKVLFVFFDLAERINRGSAYFASKYNLMKKGLPEEEAIAGALDKVRKTQFGYGKIDMPLILQNPALKSAFQFSTFPIKQAELMGGWVRNKEYAKLLTYTMATLGITWSLGDMLNIDWRDAFTRNIMPGLGPLPDTVGAGWEWVGAKTERAQEEAKTKFLRGGKLFIPAGLQLSKTFEGIKAYGRGASLTPSGKVRYRIKKTDENFLKSLLFGQFSVSEAQRYFNKPKGGGKIKRPAGIPSIPKGPNF